MNDTRIILPGGAGLVGQNLVARLKQRGYTNLVVLDKHRANIEVLRSVHPDITVEYADLAEPGDWTRYFEGAAVVVMLQAQIGGPTIEPFIRNNLTSTTHVLAAIKQFNIPYTVHISSSVVESVGDDFYTDTKKQQEEMVLASGIECVVLRPTLMFGWFDRKHLGWLSRFMQRVPVFPIPGSGRYMRQPLYAGDFCNVIISCIESRISGKVFNITGLEQVDYIDIIRQIKAATNARCAIVRIPYGLFYVLLKVYALFDKNPPFTADQLKALTAGDEFEVIDWEGIFQIKATPFAKAMHETFNDPMYSQIALEF
ncbi:NAD-dependent epimerase/dehydratase family protein [Paraburkholderia sp. SEWSISQ10-3 4]|uniref:NAD-dependent epimerase/dehydratase family protein n=1 Tax=Paraburkholderia TaxID=1822464 RepID=UPI002252C8F5|nr:MULTISPECIES: NAD-dependent epimerase/dehydratase family protein [Paraburkholderia]MCX4140329.1 NAD-dependent epimerase/dehydratase family protein [Paraburkholderia aspalathi]MDN7173016.1 NAD-dependent epimerase/dehydratase family protein [Paraburkholderia sp. SEWSISQ10-3 4]MDQ6502655.1 NAD-dependent epimerase/dehydratase family protein [Paraburkholderia aspalathi]